VARSPRLALGPHRHRDSAAVDFVTMMALEPHGTDVWVGAGPRYPWGGLYGGQIVAQALRAGTFTIEDR
jgi:acyl-CoA thioesterase II